MCVCAYLSGKLFNFESSNVKKKIKNFLRRPELPGGWGGGVCEMKASRGVKKMVNYYPLIAHSAKRMKFFAEIMPHIVQLDHFACN